MKTVLILNEGPYGSERSYNGLRLAIALRKNDPEHGITVFLMGDAVNCAHGGQKPPEGFYNVSLMIKRIADGGGAILLCGTCMEARGLTEAEIVSGAKRSNMDTLASSVHAADKVIVF